MNKYVQAVQKYLLFTSLLLALSACTTSYDPALTKKKSSHSYAQVNEQFSAFKDSFLDEFWSFQPGWGAYVGYYKYDDKLVIPNADSQSSELAFYRSTLKKLEAYEGGLLSASNATDLALIKNQLLSSVWYQTTFKNYQWDPSVYNVANIFGLILGTDYKPLDERLKTISRRLVNVPAYYKAAKLNIVDPTVEHVTLAIQQNKGALAVFNKLIPAKINQSKLSDAERSELKVRLRDAGTAVSDYVVWLEAIEGSLKSEKPIKTPRSFRIGKELYQTKFKYDIYSNYTAEQAYNNAIAERDELHQRMYKITVELWSKYLADKTIPVNRLVAIKMMIDKLSSKHIDRENFVNEIRRQMPIIQKFIDEKQLLDSDPSRPLVVREAPEYQRGIAGASVNAPGPYDATANTYYNVSPLDDYTDEQAESYLREYNHWILQMLNIHEALPGHYTQLMHANKTPSKIKSVFGNGAMIEGWAVYSELMMMEAGYGDHEPELWLMYSKWNLRAVINTILDYQVHVMGMTKNEAIDMLMQEGFQEQTEADGKWRRVTVSQVQLTSYFNGYAEILAFREELKAKMGEKFDLRTFHNKFLSYGNAPVPVIRKLMLKDWNLVGS